MTTLTKLTEFGGDSGKWMNWLRQSVKEMNQTNLDLVEKELRRTELGKDERDKHKWQVKIRLKSWSHSIRGKTFKKWNEQVNWIKLTKEGQDKGEFVVRFTLPKQIHGQQIWTAGREISWMFAISFNVGAFGYFWWYLPTFVSKYYEEIIDLENHATVIVEPPPLVVSWGNRVLEELDLSNIAQVFFHMTRATPEQRRAYELYAHGLALVAKNDIFGQLESGILLSFYKAFCAGMKGYGDWDGLDDTFDVALDRLLDDVMKNLDTRVYIKEILQLASDIADRREPSRPIKLEDAMNMKTYCDLLLQLRARQEVKRRDDQEKA